MNKKLLETRLNSVNHYVQEIKNLEQARRVTESTLNDLVNSFIEFVPYEKGDILLLGNTVFRVAKVKEMGRDDKGVYVILHVNYPLREGYSNDISVVYIRLSNIENIKIIYSEPKQQQLQ